MAVIIIKIAIIVNIIMIIIRDTPSACATQRCATLTRTTSVEAQGTFIINNTVTIHRHSQQHCHSSKSHEYVLQPFSSVVVDNGCPDWTCHEQELKKSIFLSLDL